MLTLARAGVGRLETVYKKLDSLPHKPHPISDFPCESSKLDVALRAWQDGLAGGESANPERRVDWIRRAMVSAAYGVRRAGYYRDARHLLRQCAKRWGHNRNTRFAHAKLPL